MDLKENLRKAAANMVADEKGSNEACAIGKSVLMACANIAANAVIGGSVAAISTVCLPLGVAVALPTIIGGNMWKQAAADKLRIDKTADELMDEGRQWVRDFARKTIPADGAVKEEDK